MKKIAIALITILALCTTVCAAPIHTYREVTTISDSITLTKVQDFYSDYNISYSYIKADLTNQNTSLTLLKSDKGTDIVDTVGNLASNDSSTVAAMNADFFSVQSGNKGFSLGIEIKDGKLNQSPINPSTMATISYMDNKVNMSYLDFHIMAVAPNGQYHEVRHLNKHTSYYGDILMYTKDFNGGMSPAPGGEVAEVVIENNTIVEFRRNMPPVQIPENGCVLVVSEGINMFLANNFNVGDSIRFDYYITPALYTAQTAFGGGAMIVSEGKALSKFSHTVSGTHPRSAIGVDKSGSTLYLVAVDGRQTASKGMTMSQLANLMVSLGCYTAVNLDGGGSTNMVASTTDNPIMHTVNSPSENRKVINAVGITYTSESTAPAGIMLNCDKNVAFIGQPVNITTYVHDANLRPVSGEVSLSSEQGSISGNVFTPAVGGYAQITATSGAASGSTQIYVMDTVAGIEVDSHIYLNVGQTSAINIAAFDALGNYAEITNPSPFEITSSDPDVISVSGNSVTAHKDGTAIISVKKDGAVSYCSVAAGGSASSYTDDFEKQTGGFKSYPSYVKGNFELSGDYAHSGKTSGKITFDFTDANDDSKGAYFNLTSKPKLDSSCDAISMWFYSPVDFNHRMRAQFRDANGELVILSFDSSYAKGQWQYLTAQIPESAAHPLTLDSVYALYLKGDVRDSGSVYIDDLSFDISEGTAKFRAAQPNIYTAPTNVSDNTFIVASVSNDAPTLASNLVGKKIDSLVANNSKSALIGNITKFSAAENSDALIIQLDTSKGGIRSTDSDQWDKMAAAISRTSKNDVFVLSDNNVFGSTEFESNVFHDYLAALEKNVYVITPGLRNSVKAVDGVHYFTLGNNSGEKLDLTHIKNYAYLEFYFGSETTYQWKSYY